MISGCEQAKPRIPVLLITGFLGSGKTTLVNHLLRSKMFDRAAVVINEFGRISIDHVLVSAPPSRTRFVDGGCLCGHVHEEIASRLLDLLARRDTEPGAGFNAVLIETSGLADPVPIIQILLTDPEVSTHFALRSVITVADGLLGINHLTQHIEFVKQAAVADLIVISKSDVASKSAVEALNTRLGFVNPGARRVAVDHRRLDVVLIAHPETSDTWGEDNRTRHWLADSALAASNDPSTIDEKFKAFSLTYDGEVTVPGLVLWMNLLAGFRGAGLFVSKA